MQFRTNADTMPKTNVQGMTVFNTNDHATKKQPMFLVLLLEFKDMIRISILYLID